MSQIGDFIGVFTPCGSLLVLLVVALNGERAGRR